MLTRVTGYLNNGDYKSMILSGRWNIKAALKYAKRCGMTSAITIEHE